MHPTGPREARTPGALIVMCGLIRPQSIVLYQVCACTETNWYRLVTCLDQI